MTSFKDKHFDFSMGSEVPSETLDRMQERTLAVPSWPASNALLDNAPVDAIAPPNVGPGGLVRYGFTAPGSGFQLAQYQILVLDDSVDWRDRLLVIWYNLPAFFDSTPGGGSDFGFNNNRDFIDPEVHGVILYTGVGTTKASGGNPTTGSGNGPLTASVAGRFAKKMLLSGGSNPNLVLYVENAAPYRLCIFNGDAPDVQIGFWLQATAKLGKRP